MRCCARCHCVAVTVVTFDQRLTELTADVAVHQIFIRVDEQCKVLCRIDSLKETQNKAFRAKVEDEYRVLM